MTEKLMNMTDRAMELLEQKSPHQLAVELVAAQDQRDAALAEARKYKLAGLGMAASMGEHVCVPEGWTLVPDMPTPEMCAAYRRADSDWEDGWAFDDNGNRHEAPVCQWAAMLAAAPKPQGGE